VLPAPQSPSGGGQATSFIIWLAAFALLFGAFVVLAGPARERKPHFWLRVAVLPLVPMVIAGVVIALGALRMLPDGVTAMILMTVVFLTIPAIILVPALLYRRPGPSPDSSDDEGGGGPGPGPPPAPPAPPRGGVPLPDAEQSRTRIREHDRRVFGGPRPRRRVREPDPSPIRDPAVRDRFRGRRRVSSWRGSPGRNQVSSASCSGAVPAVCRAIAAGGVSRAGEGSAAASAATRSRSSGATPPASTVLPTRPPSAHTRG
jgi:hypothetical protein